MTRRILIVIGSAIVAALAVGAAVGAILTSNEPSVLDRVQGTSDRLPANAAFSGNLEPNSSRRVASFELPSKASHAVFVSRTKDGKQICLFDTDLSTGDQGGGCNPQTSFFAGQPIAISLGFDGGPDPNTITDVRIIGLAAPSVDSVSVELSDDSSHAVPLTSDGAFVWVRSADDEREGIVPVRIIAEDASGKLVGSESLSF
jgi:hypothetical protein